MVLYVYLTWILQSFILTWLKVNTQNAFANNGCHISMDVGDKRVY